MTLYWMLCSQELDRFLRNGWRGSIYTYFVHKLLDAMYEAGL